ncbi:hypothetical protein GXP67_30720 [Rhodocytophaga rosea]|uniref:STAS/SEC14 domain-containing protein n=1 Tax=Rhodocytophaga rosea TaxID=2704465 RepID=A0A6C0GTF1_9BACT|nr:hypothetical protein [Rhodocytophaga rosea]QHT70712.1 hypothetical protein GXP67_30720 [Rhodocytophaga rosea]
MKLISIYENDQATTALMIPEDDDFVLVQLSGAVDHESYKMVFDKLYQIIAVYKYRNVIYDLKSLTNTEEHSRSWFVTNFLPKVIKNLGTNFRTATIRPENTFEGSSVDFLTELSQKLGFTNAVCSFDSREQAINWILDKKRSVM